MGPRIGKHAICPCESGRKFGLPWPKSHTVSNKIEEIKTDPELRKSWEAMVKAGIPFHGVHPSFVLGDKRIKFIGDKYFSRLPIQTFHEFVLGFLRTILASHGSTVKGRFRRRGSTKCSDGFKLRDNSWNRVEQKRSRKDKNNSPSMPPARLLTFALLLMMFFILLMRKPSTRRLERDY
jgi:hypothetical protein